MENIIELEFSPFPTSLNKVLYDLGGRYVEDGEPIEGWYNPKNGKN